ncbi:UDP-glucose dehydrogenase family protein [Gimesia maris]|uniref:UDP-glucose 6-dehydrogenase n=1 Tax=Gimesia maris TaxID=122 RepID=A0A3D3RFL7_9PLAN|nr:UDP-glucose/GDP-mannose dehydrogenase family protein [Gimesia maris]MAC54690.1 UDP-glucose/GDP-mannose dehydrogenase family protein [Gimesia sp.]HAW28464.1 UDP-glucose/GDP-mannose dehydrogenase family protein [Planctomycetaceae bacterium]EDL57695.1 UDP-glucose 6-dehydrogenase [Gimesia maris DSM 8797]QDT79109.1 UDP-glucose 6-dehydrogenase [Gimesia maris]QDU14648.1 UDP-glucose 6-dehydrogenase [Gimesia maris]|tara:strand:+ start:106 stop:1416 length:1311 start_codon:yes stop_codon:yes gene_type:complete
MKIAVIGTGYVGLVTGTCFAESGNHVTCIDIDEQKVQRLNAGEIPIFEPGLEEMVKRNSKARRLLFTTSYDEAIPEAKCIFIAVGTPQKEDGSANLDSIWKVAESLAPLLPEDSIVIIKSTVPVGTNRKLAELLQELTGRVVDVASNPEFLKEGAAIDDFSKPDRVVVGVSRPEISDTLHELYKPFLRTEHPFLSMELESAEMTKYVANCMLATKISFINEMANLCERVGADINQVRRGIGHDQRIGFSFLFPGVGYGGSCFPKDVSALISVAKNQQMEPSILNAVDQVNTAQKKVLFEKVNKYFKGSLQGKTFAIWGLAFKPKTDDIREAPALVLIDQLLQAGAQLKVHDPVAMDNVKDIYGDQLAYFDHHYDTLQGSDALIIVTEWNEFRHADFDYILHKLQKPVIFDGRNLYDPDKMKQKGFEYIGIGLSNVK